MLVTMIAKIMGEDHASRGEKSEASLAELGSSVFPERSLIKIGIFPILRCVCNGSFVFKNNLHET